MEFNESGRGAQSTWNPLSQAGSPGREAQASVATSFESGGQADCCMAEHRGMAEDADHRGLLSEVQFSEVTAVFHELEQFVRRNPGPMLALGFIAGYMLSRSKVR